ncbi:hypothetical protein B0T18DRAFT_192070 [Schizothecium vesticola]|uniref:Uncharacterized protein n=1 Tax=Schizothecium vesticola TaxID=314040 RepID=A0AA40K2T7_9PEZI|nr:hypothetical protein B0T18DRAFT_192070 [Schizothecium vesticola]
METDQQHVNCPPAAYHPSQPPYRNSPDDLNEGPERSTTVADSNPSSPHEEGRPVTLQIPPRFLLRNRADTSLLPIFKTHHCPGRLRNEATRPDAVAGSTLPSHRPRDNETSNTRREMSERRPDTESMASNASEETLLFSRAFGLRPSFADHEIEIASESEGEEKEPAGNRESTADKTSTEKTATDSNIRRVIVCYGGQGNVSHGSAFVVLVEANDPESQWRQLRNQWFEKRGSEGLRRVLERLGYGVNKIRTGKVRIQRLPSDTNDGMFVDYRMVDSKSEAEMLAQFAEAQKHIAEPYRGDSYGPSPEYSCFYDDEGNSMLECYNDFDSRTPAVRLQSTKKKYESWDSGKQLAATPKTFENQSLQVPIPGMEYLTDLGTQKVGSTYRKLKAVYKTTRYHPGPYSVEFDGLHIVEGWTLDATSVAIPALAMTLTVVVIASRLLFGDWATAWTVAGSLSGFIAVGLMWIHRELGR